MALCGMILALYAVWTTTVDEAATCIRQNLATN
jgi:hypothetical protein